MATDMFKLMLVSSFSNLKKEIGFHGFSIPVPIGKRAGDPDSQINTAVAMSQGILAKETG